MKLIAHASHPNRRGGRARRLRARGLPLTAGAHTRAWSRRGERSSQVAKLAKRAPLLPLNHPFRRTSLGFYMVTAHLDPYKSAMGKSQVVSANGGAARTTRTQRDVETELLKQCAAVMSYVTHTHLASTHLKQILYHFL
eukprot:242530-Prorocentrum_minimum.AAC.3